MKEVIKKRNLYFEDGLTQKEIGSLFNVCQSNISRIVKKITWTIV